MVTKSDIPGLMLEACPSFGPAFTESCAKFGEENMLYVHATAFANHLLSLYRAAQCDEFPAVGAFVEHLLTEGGHCECDFARFGILKSIRTVWRNNDPGAEALLPHLGPFGKEAWRESIDSRNPVYDVADYFPDKIDEASKRFPVTLAYELRGRFVGESYRLLPPEIAVEDFCDFDAAMGNGFAVHLGYCGGPESFIRGLNAAKVIGADEHVKLMEEAKAIIERHGLTFPDPLPKPWWDPDEGIGWDMEQPIEADLGDLNNRYFQLHPYYKKTKDVYLTLLEYVYSHRDELVCRKTPPLPPRPPPLPPQPPEF